MATDSQHDEGNVTKRITFSMMCGAETLVFFPTVPTWENFHPESSKVIPFEMM